VYKVLVEKTEGKQSAFLIYTSRRKPVVTPRERDLSIYGRKTLKMDLQEILFGVRRAWTGWSGWW
jgi:hypothetical protein